MNPAGGCGPKNGFKGVSDILAKGVQLGNGRKPVYFFISDPDDAAATGVGPGPNRSRRGGFRLGIELDISLSV